MTHTVIPCLNDSHSHPETYGMHLFRPDLAQVKNIAEMAALIEQRVAETAPGVWITNSGFWNETNWKISAIPPASIWIPSRQIIPYFWDGAIWAWSTAQL